MRGISEIIEAAGGAKGIEVASNRAIRRDAVYKWASIGIPDRHWEVVIPLANTTPDELYKANLAARAGDAGSCSQLDEAAA